AGRLVGEHAIAVVLNVGNIVKRAQQSARIKNSDHAVGTVSAAILHHARLNGGDAAVVFHRGLQVNNGARAAAMRPKHFFASVGDLHRLLRRARGDGGNNFDGDHFTFSAEATTDQR